MQRVKIKIQKILKNINLINSVVFSYDRRLFYITFLRLLLQLLIFLILLFQQPSLMIQLLLLLLKNNKILNKAFSVHNMKNDST